MTTLCAALLAGLLAAHERLDVAQTQPMEPVPDEKITLEFRGTLADGLRELAQKGHLNLVVSGVRDQRAEIYLNGVAPRDALAIVAEAHGLAIDPRGDVLIVKPLEEPRTKTRHRRNGETGKDRVRTGSVRVESHEVLDTAVAFGGSIDVEGELKESAVAFGGGVHLGPRARVGGDVVSFGGSITRDPGSELGGQEVSFGGGLGSIVSSRVRDLDAEALSFSHRDREFSLAGLLVRFAAWFFLGILFVVFLPRNMRRLEGSIQAEPAKCLLLGSLAAAALVPVTVLLAITLIGIPAAIVLWLFVAVGVVMGLTAVANTVATRLPVLGHRESKVLTLAVGMGILALVWEIPVLGFLVLLPAATVALGTVVRTRFGTQESPPLPST